MIKTIGSMVVAILMMAIPILATLSWVHDWDDFIKFIFIVGTLVEFIGLANVIDANTK